MVIEETRINRLHIRKARRKVVGNTKTISINYVTVAFRYSGVAIIYYPYRREKYVNDIKNVARSPREKDFGC